MNNEETIQMNTTHYLFEFVDSTYYEMTCAVSFKDAIWEMAKYTGEATELMQKALRGFDRNDVEGLIDIFNHFSYSTIQKVYVVEKLLYDDMRGGVQE